MRDQRRVDGRPLVAPDFAWNGAQFLVTHANRDRQEDLRVPR
jgi:hypothetical protein